MTTPTVRSLGSASGSGPPEPAPSPPQAARVTAAAVPAAPSRNILRLCMGFLLEIAVWGFADGTTHCGSALHRRPGGLGLRSGAASWWPFPPGPERDRHRRCYSTGPVVAAANANATVTSAPVAT